MRQKLVRAIGAAAVATLMMGGAAACKADSGSGTGTGSAACDLKVGFFGALTGDSAGLGIHMRNGTKLAIDQYTKTNPSCKVALEEYDSQGDPAKAPALAKQAVSDAKVVGIIGPAFSGESEVADPIFEAANLPTISPSATRPSLSTKGWKTFHRGVGNDESQGPAAGRYIKTVLKADKAYIVDDQSAYGAGLADEVKKVLGADGVAGTDKVQVKQTDFSAVTTKIVGSGAKILFFGGYYTEAGLLLKQLKGAGWTGTMVAGDGVNDANFITVAGEAVAEGTILTCPCAPATAAKGTFVTDYKAAFTNDPGTYADVSYDITNIMLEGIKAGKTTRADLNTFITGYNKTGAATGVTYKFEPTGELDPAQVIVWAFKVKAGKVVPDVEIPKS